MMDKPSKNFRIYRGKGFHMHFPNGYCISIQFGKHSYCDHYNNNKDLSNEECGDIGSDTAECAIFDPAGNFINLGDPLKGPMEVKGYATPMEVLTLINYAASMPAWNITKEDNNAKED